MAFKPVAMGSCTDLRGMMPGAFTSARWRLSAEEREALVRVLRLAFLEGARAERAGESIESLSFGSLLSHGSHEEASDGDTMWLDDGHDDFDVPSFLQ